MRKQQVDEQSQLVTANAKAQESMSSARTEALQQELNEAKAAWEREAAEMKLIVEKYKADLSAYTTLETKLMEIQSQAAQEAASLRGELEEVRGRMN